jgi:4-hydroxy-4-methyl-2-oxoglutarate aldolase
LQGLLATTSHTQKGATVSGKFGMDLSKLIQERDEHQQVDLPMPTAELCDRYQALFTGAVNDVLREMNLLHQALKPQIAPLRDDMVVAGIAFTVKGSKNMTMGDDMDQRAAMLAAIHEDAVVVYDTTDDDESSQFGEVMSTAAMQRGARGAIVDGGIRDTRQILKLGFPIWYRYRSSSAMLGRFRMIGHQIPIKIGNVMIFPGDVIMADIDGALVVPRHLAMDVLLRSEEIAANEEKIKDWVAEGLEPGEIVKKGGYF